VFCRVLSTNFPADCQQDWPMKKDQQCDANKQAGDHATPKPPVTPRLCLIVLGHGATLLPLCRRAKSKWHHAAVPGFGDLGYCAIVHHVALIRQGWKPGIA
jgi:hypothetical protein